MAAATRDRRRDAIMDIAVEVLADRGYRDTTMLEVAKRASASKETLYAWFGNKRGLFEAVIRRNAEAVQSALAEQLAADAPTECVLTAFGRALLTLLLGDSAVAINRAAISEARSDPALADSLAQAGRGATLPAFVGFLERQRERGLLSLGAADEAAEQFLGLLVGDLQVRRLLGLLPVPQEVEIAARANRAATAFMHLYGAQSAQQDGPR